MQDNSNDVFSLNKSRPQAMNKKVNEDMDGS